MNIAKENGIYINLEHGIYIDPRKHSGMLHSESAVFELYAHYFSFHPQEAAFQLYL